MNILYVYEFYTPHVGGGEIALQHLAEGMAARGHTVHVVTSRLPGTSATQTLNGVRVHRVWVPAFASRYWFMLLSVSSIFRFAKSADFIHTFTYTAVPPAWLVATLRNKKIVLTVHEFWGKLWKSFSGLNQVSALLHQWFERSLFFLPMTQWVAISFATEKNLREIGVSAQKLSIIYQGIDQKLFSRPPEKEIMSLRTKMNVADQTFVYLFFGRPGISKGLEYLLRAVPEISRTIPDSQLWLILAKEPAAQYQKMIALIKHLGIESSVCLIDPVERKKLPIFLAAAQAVVVPSLSEGFGFSVAEACTVGTPVVGTSVGSIPEVISGKYILIPPADPTAIAQAIQRVREQDLLYTPLKKFTWEENAVKHEQLYNSLTR